MSCEHYVVLSQDHRHYIDAAQYNNCVLCAANQGPLTQEQIGGIFGVTKERINQIEHSAVKKLRRKLHQFLRPSTPSTLGKCTNEPFFDS